MRADVRALFQELADRSPAERESHYASHQIAADVRDEVESLLRFDGAAGPSLHGYVAAARETFDIPEPGKRYGSYRLVRLLGSGGMGAVYEAEQENPRRSVALKVIKAGFANPELVRRFVLEAEALGRLQHPGIAQVYEAGTADTPFGPQPFFAMEFVRGRPLRDFVAAQALDARGRLDLVARICDAVHHAHQRGIVHRDLKPENILVDDTGQPKILDFGVARVTNSDMPMADRTHTGQLVGTLAYMSPEQVSGDPLDVDTRTDVYALGVILYELLAKRLPYSTAGTLHETIRAIRDDDPAALGTIDKGFRGDIETIVAKALDKDKARRYDSAAALASDIRRYLHDEPIVARRPSTIYQIQKFARRNTAMVAGVAAVFVVLIAGIIASTWQATRAMRAERVAAQEAATTKAIDDFLLHDLLAQASAAGQAKPGTKPDPDIKVRTALDRAAAGIGGKFDKQPAIEASIRTTIGQTYKELGLYAEAQRQFERTLELQQTVLGSGDPATLSTMGRLASLYITQGRYKQAEPLAVSVAEAQRRLLGEDHPETLASALILADLYRMQRKLADAETLLLRLIPAQQRVKGADHPDAIDSQHMLAVVYRLGGKYAQAESQLQEVLARRRRAEGDEHPDTLDTINDLVVLYDAMGKYAQAEALAPGLVEVERRIHGEEHDKTSTGIYELGILYLREGKYAEAEPLLVKARDLKRKLLGDESGPTLTVSSNLGVLYTEEGKLAEAEALLRQVLAARIRVIGEQHPDTLTTRSHLAQVFRARGDYRTAESMVSEVRDVRRRVLGPQNFGTFSSANDFGLVCLSEGKYHDAETAFDEALTGRRRALGDDHPDTLVSMTGLAEAFAAQHAYDRAEPIAVEALQRYEKTRPDNWRRYRAQSLVGAVRTGERKFPEAEPLLLAAYQGLVERQSTIPAPERSVIDQTADRLADLYQQSGQPAKAAEWRARRQASTHH